MIKYAIIDDEPIAHSIIEKFAKKINSLEKVGNCYDVFQALDLLQHEKLDLLFLDINMPKLSGFEMLKTLKYPPKIIVTTAYQEYALEGYELEVVDYLLKPFSFPRFLKAINKVLEFKKGKENAIVESKDYVEIKVGKRKHRVKLNEILYIEAQGNYCKVVTESDKLLSLYKISDFQEELPKQFIRVHNSFIVNIDKITASEGNRIYIDTNSIPVGRTYKKGLDKL